MSADPNELRHAQLNLEPSDYICWLLNTRGMGARNIALVLDLSRTTVRDRIQRAHKTLIETRKEKLP